MGFKRKKPDTYNMKVYAHWNCEDYPLPSGANLVSIRSNMELALHQMGYHGSMFLWAYGNNLNESDIEKAGFKSEPVQGHETSHDLEMSLGIVTAASANIPVIVVAIAKLHPESECLRVLRSLKSRTCPVLCMNPLPAETGDGLFPCADSVFNCTQYLDGDAPSRAVESDGDESDDDMLTFAELIKKHGWMDD